MIFCYQGLNIQNNLAVRLSTDSVYRISNDNLLLSNNNITVAETVNLNELGQLYIRGLQAQSPHCKPNSFTSLPQAL